MRRSNIAPPPPTIFGGVCCRHRCRLASILLVFVSFRHALVDSSSVKWQAGKDQTSTERSGKLNAATAPRSQKYWDEHAIERPEYGKTDAEVAGERISSVKASPVAKVFLGMAISAALLSYSMRSGMIIAPWNKGSHRLGGSRQATRQEDARAARLARFEKED